MALDAAAAAAGVCRLATHSDWQAIHTLLLRISSSDRALLAGDYYAQRLYILQPIYNDM